MSAITANTVAPGAMYVRALYDYDADDRTSLSFRQGDIIQVITQLESGWWDGVIYGVRGWFPSNYCAVITGTEATQGPHAMQDQAGDSEPEDAYANSGLGIATPGFDGTESKLHLDTDIVQEEAAFWIPQATPDGRLFYFNTLTGVSTMELPLETPTSASDYRSRDASGAEPRPAAEMLAGGLEREEQQTELDNLPRSRSHLANGASPLLTSASSLMAPSSRGRSAGNDTVYSAVQPKSSVSTSFSNNPLGLVTGGIASQALFADSTHAFPSSWDSLVENMRRCVQFYKTAIEHGDRAEFVKRAEDISDHLRNLLAAGSGTTDNHSGNPSIISTNKTLYPHFREMMSSFSKLVLSSHFAAADFTSPDSYTKCLQEADGLLRGTDGFVLVARQQRGEELPRLTPGFFAGTRSGGHWRNQGLNIRDASLDLPLVREQGDVLAEPNTPLDATLLERMEDLKKLIIASIRRLDEHLVLRDALITPSRHLELGDNICKEAGRILELCRPYITTVETVNLSPFGNDINTAQLEDFATHKQRFYDATSEVVVSCQAVSSPLGDEWSSERGPSMEERLENLRLCSRGLERATSQLQYSIQLLAEILPADPGRMSIDSRRTAYEGKGGYQEVLRNRGINTNVGTPRSFSEVSESMSPAQSQKIHRFFGEVPVPISQTTTNDTVVAEDKPPFLGLDHENEIAYDIKTTPPQLRGGTLVGLVEQLTRHDKLDSSFNNTFLLTYRSFTTANELFEMLVKRWCIQPPQNLGPLDIQRWIDKKQKPIRFRVVNILKSWFDSYWMEGTDEAAQQLMQRVFTFAKETVASTSTPGAGPLMTAIEQRMRGQDASSKRMILTHSGSMPAAIVPKNIKKLKFLDIDTLEFARQLTIIESRLYHKIKSTECLNKTWQKKVGEGEPDPAANVKALILHSNQLTNWVAQMILTQADVKRRQIVIKHFVSIADKCRAMNNFSTLTSIISALGTAPIHRLGRTWSQVNQKTMASLETMRALMGSTKNFLEYRETLHKANPPCIPFFGVYLTDLTFIEDGIPSIIKKTNLINFAKRAKTAEVIRDIQQFQNVPYQLQAVAELQDYILKNMQTAGDVHEMYERSLQVEPREREDEKIARLLSESGFL